MTTQIEYLPNVGFKINTVLIPWMMDRVEIRQTINLPYSVLDRQVLANPEIISKRDIYKDVYDGKNSFFLNYDSNNKLIELEIHSGIDIILNKVQLDFEKSIHENLNKLKTLTTNFKEIEEGNYFFPDLKFTIADHESFGGNGHNLGYFYGAMDVSHLDE